MGYFYFTNEFWLETVVSCRAGRLCLHLPRVLFCRVRQKLQEFWVGFWKCHRTHSSLRKYRVGFRKCYRTHRKYRVCGWCRTELTESVRVCSHRVCLPVPQVLSRRVYKSHRSSWQGFGSVTELTEVSGRVSEVPQNSQKYRVRVDTRKNTPVCFCRYPKEHITGGQRVPCGCLYTSTRLTETVHVVQTSTNWRINGLKVITSIRSLRWLDNLHRWSEGTLWMFVYIYKVDGNRTGCTNQYKLKDNGLKVVTSIRPVRWLDNVVKITLCVRLRRCVRCTLRTKFEKHVWPVQTGTTLSWNGDNVAPSTTPNACLGRFCGCLMATYGNHEQSTVVPRTKFYMLNSDRKQRLSFGPNMTCQMRTVSHGGPSDQLGHLKCGPLWWRSRTRYIGLWLVAGPSLVDHIPVFALFGIVGDVSLRVQNATISTVWWERELMNKEKVKWEPTMHHRHHYRLNSYAWVLRVNPLPSPHNTYWRWWWLLFLWQWFGVVYCCSLCLSFPAFLS